MAESKVHSYYSDLADVSGSQGVGQCRHEKYLRKLEAKACSVVCRLWRNRTSPNQQVSGLEERPLPIPTSLEQIVHRGGIVNLSSIWSCRASAAAVRAGMKVSMYFVQPMHFGRFGIEFSRWVGFSI